MYAWPSVSDFCLSIADEYVDSNFTKLQMYIDHKLPCVSPADASFHNSTIKWCEQHNVPITYGQGIGHQLTVERGLVRPGHVVVHFDRHVNILGALGVFSVGTRMELIQALILGKFSIITPQTVRIELTGKLQDGVIGRDLLNRLLQDLGPDAAPDEVIEFGGSGAVNISIDSRLTICCLAMFLGCMTAMFEPDEVTKGFYRQHFNLDVPIEKSDSNCQYAKVIHYDLGSVEPMIVVPPKPQTAVPLKMAIGTPVQQGNIASCAAGRIEDIAIAARILKGRKIAKGFRLYITPSSINILQEAVRLGYMDALAQAGAFFSSSTCDFCYGRQGVPADGDNVITTGTLNVPGRMGNTAANLYIGSAAAVAAASITAAVVDPRDYL
jgi:3-isopropylmalate/(R)-2-methylmalate dehydratase large subunit